MKVLCFYFSREVELSGLADIFYRYSPQIALRGKQSIFLEVSHEDSLYKEQTILARCRSHLKKLGLTPHYAMGDDVPSSLGLAVFGSLSRETLPLEALSFYLTPFRDDPSLHKNMQIMIDHLKKLGLSTVSDFCDLPASGLINRFGAVGKMLVHNVERAQDLVWPRYVPVESVEECLDFDFDAPAESIEPILFHLKVMLEKIYLRLRGRGQRVKIFSLEMSLEHKARDKSDIWSLDVHVTSGVVTSKTIFLITKERLSHEVQVRPLSHGITAVRVLVRETTPYLESQRDIFDPRKEEQEEAFHHLLTRLKTRLGDQHVFVASPVASYLPESNWRKDGRVDDTAIVPLKERPLRLFQKPIPVQASNGGIHWEGRCFTLKNAKDREVILSEWWRGFTERVYFCLADDDEGLDLWMFRSQEGLFIHGFFD